MTKRGSYVLIEKESITLGNFQGSSFRFDDEIYLSLLCGQQSVCTQCINLAGPCLVGLPNDTIIEPINLEIKEV